MRCALVNKLYYTNVSCGWVCCLHISYGRDVFINVRENFRVRVMQGWTLWCDPMLDGMDNLRYYWLRQCWLVPCSKNHWLHCCWLVWLFEDMPTEDPTNKAARKTAAWEAVLVVLMAGRMVCAIHCQ